MTPAFCLDPEPRQRHPERSPVQTQKAGPTPEFPIQRVWEGTQESAFLTRSQVMPTLVLGPHTENLAPQPAPT